jgi:peptidylprolyl isomerase
MTTRAVVAATLVAVPLLAACGSDGPSFQVGDCVRIEQRTVDSDLDAADCDDAVGTFEADDRIYQVDSIIDNTDGGCPALEGFFPVEFIHEPDGVTYCLVQQDGGDSSTESEGTTTTAPETTATTALDYTKPALAKTVLERTQPTPKPPPADLAADALESTTLIEGEGEGAEAGDQITVHYIGLLADGTVFDQSWERGEPFTATLGQGQVIPGWEQGLIGAKIGERRRLEIGSDNAYGEQGAGEDIPPNAPLAFEVDVVDIKPGE